MNPTPTFRPVATRADWDSYLAIRNDLIRHRPATVEQIMGDVASRPQEFVNLRYLMGVEGHDVAFCSIQEAFWMTSERRFEFLPHALDEQWFGGIVDYACQLSTESGAQKLSTWARSDTENRIVEFLMRGFVETQRNPESALALDSFDSDAYSKALQKLSDDGFEIVTYRDLSIRRPHDWRHLVWRLEMDVLADVPFPEPFKESSFETFVKELELPHNDHSAMFLALVDGEPIGMTQLLPNPVDPTVVSTGLTGVLRPYRQRGLATGLKALALTWAKKKGAQTVWTDNEENNPMYRLNAKLGFKTQFDSVCLEKVV